MLNLPKAAAQMQKIVGSAGAQEAATKSSKGRVGGSKAEDEDSSASPEEYHEAEDDESVYGDVEAPSRELTI